jgi:probable Rubsico expression protein CbbX
MWGFHLKYLKASMALLACAVGVALAWSLFPRLWSIALTCFIAVLALSALIGRDVLRQSRKVGSDYSERRSGLSFNIVDPGLRRDWTPLAPVRGTVVRPAATGFRPGRMTAQGTGAPRHPGARRRRGGEILGADTTVTLAEERRAAQIDDLFTALDAELVGLVPVKKKVEEIGSLLLVDRARQRFGLSASRPNLHMCFTGAPGTGKTTVALKLADLLRRLGYLEKGHLVHAMRDDLVGEYIGHTAPKTKAVLDRAMGGVLFIDEAYSLFRSEDSKDYGQECIDILLQVMENDRDKLVVILAGYKDRMDHFFDCNPGMVSRIAHHLDFADYTLDELLAIGQLMLGQSSYYLSDEAAAAFRDFLASDMRQPRFANARGVRNELERSRLKHAYRLAAEPDKIRTMDDLMRLEPTDIGAPWLVN